MRTDLSALREMVVQNLEEAQRSVERHQAMLDTIDAGCIPVSGPPVISSEDDFDEANLISTGEAARIAGVAKVTIRSWVKEKGIGRRKGGRVVVSLPRLLRHIGQG